MAVASKTKIKKIGPTDTVLRMASETIRSSTALTGSYVDTDEVHAEDASLINFLVEVTGGASSTFNAQILGADHNRTKWFLEQTEAAASGTITLSDGTYSKSLSSATERFMIRFPASNPYVKMRVKGTGNCEIVAVSCY